jgi:anti-anti-sigma factor
VTTGPEESTVDVLFNPVSAPGHVAIVHLRGEHDIATGHAILDILGPISGSVIIDLSACTFLDSSVIGLFLNDHQTRQRERHSLTLVVPPANVPVRRVLAIVGVGRVLEVLDELPEA